MANQNQVKRLETSLGKATEYLQKELVKRPEWGVITFEKADPDLRRAKDIVRYLQTLPTELLPDNTIDQVTSALEQIVPMLDQIDKFNIEQNAAALRDNIATQLHTRVDSFYTVASPWVPFLAYQKGDVAGNISKLTKAIDEAKTILQNAHVDTELKKKEMDEVIRAARAASASAGAAVFTEDFLKEADAQSENSKTWLKVAAGFGAATMLAAGIMWKMALDTQNLDPYQWIQIVVAKLVLLSVLIGAATWCSGVYKALQHLSKTNKHRALSLRTLQAFTKAASDDGTKNAVLMEACRAVFVNGATGYLPGKDHAEESTLKIVEIAKSLGGKVGH